MPIRINLLAEEQAAEEMRRKDPVKRVVLGGIVLTAMMILWIALTAMKSAAARSELAQLETRLTGIERDAAAVKSNQSLIGELETRIEALDKYAAHRFFSASLLDALQHAAVPNIRLMEVRLQHTYREGDVTKLFSTNIVVNYTPPPPAWKFWASKPAQEPLFLTVSNIFKPITNAAPFSTNNIPYKTTMKALSTNTTSQRITVQTEFATVPWTTEQITVQIRGRDYGRNAGAAIDEFAKRLTQSAFFQEWVEPVQGLRFTERPPQPRPDPSDPINPGALFLPFTIESSFKERLFTE